MVHIDGKQIDVEVTVLIDSEKVRQLDCITRKLDKNFWISCTEVDYVERLKNKIKEKSVKSAEDAGLIVILNQYAKFINPIDAINLIRRIVLDTKFLQLSNRQYLLALAYVHQYYIQGVWFNLTVCNEIGILDENKEHVRTALKNSFYPREDGLFFHEKMTDSEHQAALDKMPQRGT